MRASFSPVLSRRRQVLTLACQAQGRRVGGEEAGLAEEVAPWRDWNGQLKGQGDEGGARERGQRARLQEDAVY